MVADRRNENRTVKWFPRIRGSVWKCDSFDQGILELFFFFHHVLLLRFHFYTVTESVWSVTQG